MYILSLRMNRREYPRISLMGKVEIRPGNSGDPLYGYAINIGRGGLALYSQRVFDLNTELLLTLFFKYYEEGEKREEVSGIVRWIKPVGDLFALGVQFKEMKKETHPVISLYLEMNER